MRFSGLGAVVRTEMALVTHTRRPFYRRLARTLLFVLAILLAAAAVNVVGISLVGGVNGWSRWLQEHSGHFAAWRGFLYAATAFGWWWMRNRVLCPESKPETRARLLRTEIAAVLAIVALEGMTFLQTR